MKINILPFSKVIKDSTRKFTKIKKESYLNSGQYKIVDQGKAFICGYTDDKNLVNFDDIPVIIFGDHTKILKFIDFPLAIGADGVKVLTVDSEIADTKYVYYYLKSIRLHDAGYSRHFKYLKVKKIPLPKSLDEQIKIANLLTQVEALIAKREESIELLDELLRSCFLDMFGDPVLNGKKWEVQPLHKVCTKIIGGGTPSKLNPSFYMGNIPWVTAKDMKFEYIVDSIDHITEEAIVKSSTNLIPINSLLMVTRSGILKKKLPLAINKVEVTMNQDMKAFIVNNNLINVEFFYHFLFSYQHHLLKKLRSVTVDNLKFDDIKRIPVYLPPKPLQDKFATIVQEVEKTKKKYQDSLDELHDLFGSLSQRAFKGELKLKDILDFKIGIDTSSIALGSKIAEGICKADGIVKLDALSIDLQKEYKYLHDTLSSSHLIGTKISPPTSSFLTAEKLSKSWLDTAYGLESHKNILGSELYEDWHSKEQNRVTKMIEQVSFSSISSGLQNSISINLGESLVADLNTKSALASLDSAYGIEYKNIAETASDRFKEIEIDLGDNWKTEQEKFHQLAGLGKYDEHIRNFTKEYKSLFNPSVTAFDSNHIDTSKYLNELQLSTMKNIGLDALKKSLEANQPYNIAQEQAEAMKSLCSWGEPYEVIESISNLSELMKDERFKNIFQTDSYDNIKELVFKLIDEGKLEQVFDEETKRLILKKVEK